MADVADEAFYLVNISYKDSNRGEVVAIQDAEVMEDSTVTKWSSDDDLVVSKLTTDGTQYELPPRHTMTTRTCTLTTGIC